MNIFSNNGLHTTTHLLRKGKCSGLKNKYRKHDMNTNLKPITNPNMIELAERLQSSIQAFNRCTSLIDGFPIGGLRILSDGFLMPRVRVNQGLRAEPPFRKEDSDIAMTSSIAEVIAEVALRRRNDEGR